MPVSSERYDIHPRFSYGLRKILKARVAAEIQVLAIPPSDLDKEVQGGQVYGLLTLAPQSYPWPRPAVAASQPGPALTPGLPPAPVGESREQRASRCESYWQCCWLPIRLRRTKTTRPRCCIAKPAPDPRKDQRDQTRSSKPSLRMPSRAPAKQQWLHLLRLA